MNFQYPAVGHGASVLLTNRVEFGEIAKPK